MPLLPAPALDGFTHPGGPVQLGLAGEHQRLNAAMAIQLCRLWARRVRPGCAESAEHERVRRIDALRARAQMLTAPFAHPQPQQLARMKLPDAYATGLAQTRWPGRAEVVADVPSQQGGADNLVFCLDGAHTGESAATCADWFAKVAPQQSIRMLMFNCQRVSASRRTSRAA